MFNSLIQPYYQRFLETSQFGEVYSAKRRWVESDEYYPKLDITFDTEYIGHFFNKSGTIPLREYNGEKTLILGCGNKPVFTCGGVYTYAPDCESSSDYDFDYRDKHSHPNTCTVNPDLGYNPTLVAHFGYQQLTYFKDASFAEIIFEGYMNVYTTEKTIKDMYANKNSMGYYIYQDTGVKLTMNDVNNPWSTVSELVRLLKDGGIVKTCNDDKSFNPLFIKKDGCLLTFDRQKTIITEKDFYTYCEENWLSSCA